MSVHFIGEHLGVTEKALSDLSDRAKVVMDEKKVAKCDCDVIQMCLDLTQDPKEVAVLSYIMGMKFGSQHRITDDDLSISRKVKN